MMGVVNSLCSWAERLDDWGRRSLDGDGALAEAVLEAARHVTQVAKTAGSGGASPLGLVGPVVGALPGARVAAGRTGLLLDVVRATAAAHAQSVRLARALSVAGRSLRLWE